MTPAEHLAALDRITELMDGDATVGLSYAEGCELDRLIAEVAEYEETSEPWSKL